MNKTLEITTAINCWNNCYYCPQNKLLEAYNGNLSMTLEQFVKILDNTPKDIQIDFAGFCEPFQNRDASKMMRYGIKNGYHVYLLTTLSNLNPKDLHTLKGLHFDAILVHEYQGFGFIKELQDKRLKDLMEVVTADKVEQFPMKEDYWFSRAGNLWDREEKKGCIACGWDNTFSRNVVLPDGNVYVCCMDYGLKHCIGNLLTTHYNDLDRQSIIDLCNSEDSDIICRKCEISKNVSG
jgi:radical SAM protein with 4Fe4S-binding SPASM domain